MNFFYTAGCNFIDDDEINFSLASGTTIRNEDEKCWIMIPRLKHSLDNYETQTTEFTVGELKNSNLLRDSTITVTNLITGKNDFVNIFIQKSITTIQFFFNL